LEQPSIDNKEQWKPVAFFSKHLSETQQKYSTSERELLAIVLSCEHFRKLLYGVKFHVYTDHQPLKALLTANELSQRLARWLSRLEMFDMEIHYREGKKNGNADGLSRMAVEPATEEEDEDSPPTLINSVSYWEDEDYDSVSTCSEEDEEVEVEVDIDNEDKENNNVDVEMNVELELIKIISVRADKVELEQLKDSNIVWIYNIIKMEQFRNGEKVKITSFANKEQECLYKQRHRLRIINKVLYRKYQDENEIINLQFIVPSHIRHKFLEKAHMSVFSAHQGRDKMIARLSSRCYWPKQYEDVADFVKFCRECQEIKPPARYNVAELIPILPNKPLEIITTDIMGPLNMTIEENKYIMIICVHFTKWIELYSLKTMEAVEVANKISSFVCRHGVPDKIITDQATNYQSNLISELYEVLDIEKARTSPYHPESDGLSE
jgi:hypothetical protein